MGDPRCDLILTLLAAAACSPGPHRPDPIPLGDTTYTIEYLDWRIQALMDDEELPGLAIALVVDQEVVWQRAYGDAEDGVPATVDTVWRVGSLTKLFTAIEVMRLVDDGLVDLDEPLDTFLPGFSVRTREEEPPPITLRSMLSHRSGLPRNSGLPTWYWDPGTDVLQA